MKEQLIQLGFEKYLSELDIAPYPVIFWDIPKFIQLAYIQKWLRDIHEINIFIYCYGFGYYPTHDNIHLPTGKVTYIDRRWNTQNKLNLGFKAYEEALEAGIEKALNLIKE